jgi:hypothetical protein
MIIGSVVSQLMRYAPPLPGRENDPNVSAAHAAFIDQATPFRATVAALLT